MARANFFLTTFRALGLAVCGLIWCSVQVANAGAALERAVLVQQMTRSVCLVLLGAEPAPQQKIVEKAAAALTSGQAEPFMAAQLITFAASAQQLANGDQHSVVLTLLMDHMHALTTQLRSEISDESQEVEPTSLAAVVELHALQVSSQVVQRDLCLAAVDIGATQARGRINHWMSDFDSTVEALLSGDTGRGFPEPPNIQVKLGLKKVKSKIVTLRPILDRAATGQTVDLADLQIASVMADSLLREVRKVASHYP